MTAPRPEPSTVVDGARLVRPADLLHGEVGRRNRGDLERLVEDEVQYGVRGQDRPAAVGALQCDRGRIDVGVDRPELQHERIPCDAVAVAVEELAVQRGSCRLDGHDVLDLGLEWRPGCERQDGVRRVPGDRPGCSWRRRKRRGHRRGVHRLGERERHRQVRRHAVGPRRRGRADHRGSGEEREGAVPEHRRSRPERHDHRVVPEPGVSKCTV